MSDKQTVSKPASFSVAYFCAVVSVALVTVGVLAL